MANSLMRDVGLLFVLAVMWSSSFTAIKVGVETLPPTTLAMLRVVVGAVILYAWLKIKGHRLPTDTRVWRTFFLIGLFGNAIPFVLINWGEQKIESGLAAILIATMPLVTLLLGRIFSDEILNTRRLLGVLCGFGGVVFLIGPEELLGLGGDVLRQLAVAVAAVCYAIAAILFRKLPHAKPLEQGSGVLIASAILLIPAAFIADQPWAIDYTVESVAIFVYLGAFPTALATLLLVVVIASRGATFLSLNNYMIPIMGVLWGYLFLGEVISQEATISLVLIVLGIVIAGVGPGTLENANRSAIKPD
ncbi:MAG: EamA family transporter [Rhodospirillaceae bacterium]|nr:MAG: EamA family transporter [Rhodospirillaceae bacterium]